MTEDTAKPRKRRRWLRRILFGLGLVVLVLAVGHWFYSNSANKQLQAELDAITARGEPIRWADLASKPISDEQNAALLYLEATETDLFVNRDAEMDRLWDMLIDLVSNRAFRGEQPEDAQALVAKGADALELVRRARKLRGVDWGIDYSTLDSLFDSGSINEVMKLSNLLVLATLHAHDREDAQAACEYLSDFLRLAEAVYSEPILVYYLVGIASEDRAFLAAEEMFCQLALWAPAARDAAEDLLSRLLDESSSQLALTRAMIGERCFGYETMERIKREDGGMRLIPDSLIARNQVNYLGNLSAFVEASRQASFPAAKRIMPVIPDDRGFLEMIQHFFADLLIPSLEQVAETAYRNVAMRRMAATALAVRLYEIDNGRRPETLALLVPDYLPAVPVDPFGEPAGPLGYLPDAEPALLYCVGENGRDDAGEFALDENGAVHWQSPDLVFFLDGNRPQGQVDRQAPDTQAANDGFRSETLPWAEED